MAVCSLVAARIAAMEDVLNVIGKLALYLVTILCGLLIHSLVLLPLVFFVITRSNPYRFMKGVGDALMTAFGIASRFVACICEHMHVKEGTQEARSIQPKFQPVRPGKVVHLKRWTRFFETFPVGPNRSIEFWTEISGNCG